MATRNNMLAYAKKKKKANPIQGKIINITEIRTEVNPGCRQIHLEIRNCGWPETRKRRKFEKRKVKIVTINNNVPTMAFWL